MIDYILYGSSIASMSLDQCNQSNLFGGILSGQRCFNSIETLHLSSALISLPSNTINLRFVSPTYRSLAIVSLMAVLTLCDLLLVLSGRACPSSVIHCRSVLLLISKSSIFTAAANWTRLILLGIYSGLNLTYLLSLPPGDHIAATRCLSLVEPVFQFSGK